MSAKVYLAHKLKHDMDESRGLAYLFVLAVAFFYVFFDFLSSLVEEHPYIFTVLIISCTIIIYRVVSLKWRPKPSSKEEKPRAKSPWSPLLGRKNIKINGMVCSVALRRKPNQPDRLYIDWDGKMILLNVWKRQPHFHVEKGRQYIFSNISCRLNKYNNQVEFHYDPEYYGSYYEEWPEQTHQKTSQSSQSTPLAEMLEKFGCSPSATVEEVKAKKRYWNQVLHPDFNVGKPEKLRKQMEEELKQKNQLYDRIMQLMST
jgi:hypothetical protein